jgi:hypothetical protein
MMIEAEWDRFGIPSLSLRKPFADTMMHLNLGIEADHAWESRDLCHVKLTECL